jgi:hypothetical protein
MRYRRSALAVLFVALFETTASAGTVAEDFPPVLTTILLRQTTGPLSQMGDAKKMLMVACINDVLAGLPKGKKRYILEGIEIAEQERRLGRIIYENRAEWLQKIAGGCARVAMRDG